ncbi:aminotransferase class I/II-fold pyridoxal phosphate-dependent enzyme [Streptomyces sp. RTd22]|uniref:aminotransferase class I/II-fold pyridoxal phosphate-dependent enzyme n=1 Tax=Streptomyces sp. RTd22 TaxID=1841249 RepID=UPI000B1657C8|nr:aminotransferase class I/II-fold pyridoxal phosphate-dependent enzyme [Streptomyces sp. RTd22]
MSDKDGWNRMQPVLAQGAVQHQMSLNETSHPPLPSVLRAVSETAAEAHRTLDALGFGLSGTIGEHLGVPPGDVAVGPGSGALLQLLFSGFTGPDTHTVHAWPSWEAYPMMAANAASTTVRVPLRDETHDLEAMAAAVTEQTRLVIVCNPNNPTGTAVGEAALRRFLDLLPSHVTVVLDEAYIDFADTDAAAVAHGLDLYREDERVCVVRTFSKSYGLLSLRVGYLVGHERTLAPLRGALTFYRVSAAAQAAAVAALAESAAIRRQCEETARERERLYGVLTEQGWQVTPSQANFLWLPMTSGVERFTQFCADHGVLVCGKPGEGVRVTIAEAAANDAFALLAAKLRDADGPSRDADGHTGGAAPAGEEAP